MCGGGAPADRGRAAKNWQNLAEVFYGWSPRCSCHGYNEFIRPNFLGCDECPPESKPGSEKRSCVCSEKGMNYVVSRMLILFTNLHKMTRLNAKKRS